MTEIDKSRFGTTIGVGFSRSELDGLLGVVLFVCDRVVGLTQPAARLFAKQILDNVEHAEAFREVLAERDLAAEAAKTGTLIYTTWMSMDADEADAPTSASDDKAGE